MPGAPGALSYQASPYGDSLPSLKESNNTVDATTARKTRPKKKATAGVNKLGKGHVYVVDNPYVAPLDPPVIQRAIPVVTTGKKKPPARQARKFSLDPFDDRADLPANLYGVAGS